MATGRHRLRLTPRQRIGAIVAAFALLVGGPLLFLSLSTTAATAAVPTGDDYPNRTMPCARAPYTVSGPAHYCYNYDWGPVRNGVESTTFSPYGYGYRNCTDFVAWRLDKVNGIRIGRYGDASSWVTNSRVRADSVPAPGSVAWFGSRNHVAWVESVNGGNVLIQDYNHGQNGTFNRYSIPVSQVTKFLHFKDLAASGGGGGNPGGGGGGGGTPVVGNQPVYPVMNTSETPPDGVWFRDNPNVSGPRLNGYGVYNGDRVQLRCYGWGESIGRYNDRLWYYSTNLTRPNAPGRGNTGWLNAHYVNDGQNANAVVPGVRPC